MFADNKMKPSRYNLFIDLESGGQLAFNGTTAALAEIDPETRERFHRLLQSEFPPTSEQDIELLSQMKHARFVCPAEFDEIVALRDRDDAQRKSKSTFFLTIAPTLACNFRCDYCFQNSSPTVMSDEVISALIRFSEQHLQGAENLMLTWFGGEPTLCFKVMMQIQVRLLELAQRFSIKDSTASIITNGYLLDGRMAQHLSEIGINEAQVTIDGPRVVHDKRRKLADGRGSFDRILTNLAESSKILRMIVRINIDSANTRDALEVVDVLEQRGLLPLVNIYFAPVNPAKGVCADASGRCLSTEEFSRIQVELYQSLVDRGIYRIEYPQVAPGGYCGAGNDNSFVVGPNGLLFKCWEQLSLDAGDSIGDVFGSDLSAQQQANLDRYRAYSPFSKTTCTQCDVLPLCLGGCPLSAASNGSHEYGHCSPWKYNLREMLTLRYKCNNHQEVTG